MNAGDIMHPTVISIARGASIHDAVRLMVTERVSGLVVVDESGAMVGMLTESDLLRRAELGTERHYSKLLTFLRGPVREAQDYLRAHARQVGDLMHSPVATVGREASLDQVVEVMERQRIRRLPVLEGGRPVGVITRSDLLRALEPLLAAEEVPVESPDPDLERAVIAALDAQDWTPPGLTLDVSGGTVTLYGAVSDPVEERAVIVLVETVPGVKEVRNEMTYVDVSTGLSLSGPG